MRAEIVRLVEQADPFLTAAARAYGGAVLAPAENPDADAAADLGRRILQAVSRRRSDREGAALAAATQDLAERPEDAAAPAAVQEVLKRALRKDSDLRAEVAALLSAPPAVDATATASDTVPLLQAALARSEQVPATPTPTPWTTATTSRSPTWRRVASTGRSPSWRPPSPGSSRSSATPTPTP